MLTRFQASQSVKISVDEQPTAPIQHYLRQPQRLVYALFDPSRVETLSQEDFRLRLRPLNFMMLSIQPVVDLHVQSAADGTIHLKSTGCEIKGVEYINQRFHLNLQGQLTPLFLETETCLQGHADLEVQVELPPPFWFTPQSFVEKTGNGLLRGILMTIKQRLSSRLIADYQQWVSHPLETTQSASSPVLSTQ